MTEQKVFSETTETFLTDKLTAKWKLPNLVVSAQDGTQKGYIQEKIHECYYRNNRDLCKSTLGIGSNRPSLIVL